MPEQAPRRTSAATVSSAAPPILLCLIVCALVLPIAWELSRSLIVSEWSFSELYFNRSRGRLLARSVLVASLIALLAMVMAIPMARLLVSRLSRRTVLLAALMISPIWLPSFMIYAAGNLLRAPDTVLGRALIELATSAPDRRWMTIWAGYAAAVLGLAVWSAPVAAVLIASGLGFRSNLYDEMLALEPAGRFRRARFWVRLHAGPLIRAWALVAVIMMGSAVPMHLAQLDTWSIVIWRELSERGPDQWGAVWVSALPTLLTGLIGAWILTCAVTERGHDDPGMARGVVPAWVVVAALGVWCMGALLPLIAMIVSLNDPRAILYFWRLESGAVRDSGLLAVATGVCAVAIALLTAFALGHPARTIRRIGSICVMALCVLGLIPGVLVGAAVTRTDFFWFDHGWGAALLASCIRTAFLGAIVGALCAGGETRDQRSARYQIAGGSIRGWAHAVLPIIAPPMLGALLISALYSLHEIEAAVMVRPPGMDNLPQRLLSDLHFARLEALSAAGVNLLATGIVVSLIGSLLLTRLAGFSRRSN